jgi:hypothetical protein
MFWPFLSAQILKNTNKSTERPSIKIATAQNFEQNLYVGLRNFSVLGTMVPFLSDLHQKYDASDQTKCC